MSDVDRVKESIDIVAVIGRYTKLDPAGKNFKGISPFTSEKTPSFFVSPDKGLWHCFSSGQGGDIFTFIQKVEGLDFAGALKLLADEAGITLSGYDPKKSEEKDSLYLIMEEALHFYRLELQKNTDAREYVLSRGINEESIKHFSLGYAPGPQSGGWRVLKNYLHSKNIPESQIEKAGLIKRGDKGAYDVFRDRIMFPIRDNAGRIVAFSGRILSKNTEAPKYVNSPDTSIFHKSSILYGYHEARGAIRKNDFAILVEGQVDLVLSHQSGFRNTVAVSGTSFTLEHAKLIKRLTNRVLMVFDNDKAGWASTLKSARLALSLGMDVKTVVLPEGKDPADIINENPEDWRSAIRDAEHVIERALSRLESAGDRRKQILAAEKIVIPLVAAIPNALDKAFFVSRIADNLMISEEAVKETLQRYSDPVQGRASATQGPGDALVVSKISKRNILMRRAAGAAYWLDEQGSEVDYKTRLHAIVDESELPHDLDVAAFEAEALFGSDESKETIEELFQHLEKSIIEEKLVLISDEIKMKERRGEDIQSLMREQQELIGRLHGLR